ncbi:MAG: NUDIX hydrolase [Patescibacteria group bacterium]|jgi:ADP-ribose pyrophosphatase YjhB (NUDIX family)
MTQIPECFYRVSIKGLILDETRTKFLVCLEDNGLWELPGGGLDWGESIENCLKREIKEEMGLDTTFISTHPLYFTTSISLRNTWFVNVIHEVKVKDLNFNPSDECREIRFVSPEDLASINVYNSVKELGLQFDSSRHI